MKPDSYFIAVTVPPQLSERMQKYRDFIPAYSTFNTPLHITIIPPFYLESPEKNLLELLEKNVSILPSANITFNTLAYFEHRSSIVYLKPDIRSETYLKRLFGVIPPILKDTIKRQFNKSSNPEEFHPHLTIAKRIPLNKLDPIKSIFQNFNEIFSFDIMTIDVYKQANSYGPWTKIAEIALSQMEPEQSK